VLYVLARRRKVTNNSAFLYITLFLGFFLIAVIYQLLLWLSSLSLLSWTVIGILLIGIIFVRKNIKHNQKLKKQEERRRALERQGNLKELRKMHPRQFEYYICDLFRQIGYDAHVTPPTGDGGKDIMIYNKDFFAIAECKRYNITTKVTRPDIQKFHSAVIDCKAEKGYFVTTGEFTEQAKSYCLDKPIELINGEKLVEIIEKITNNNNNFDNKSLIL
jgi:restriction system protein